MTSPSRRETIAHWLAAAATLLLAAEAVRQAEWYWLAAVGIMATALALRIHRHSGSAARGLIGALIVVSLSAVGGGVITGHTRWHANALQQEAVHDATVERDRLLQSSVATARHTATLALDRVGNAGPTTSPSLTSLLGATDIEMAVAVIAGDTVIAVAGPHRMQPVARNTPAALVSTPFARLLVLRVSRGHRQAQVILLLDSLPGLPIAAPSLAQVAGHWQRVQWHWDPGLSRTVEFGSVEAAVAGVMTGMRAAAPPVAVFILRDARVARLIVAGGIVLAALLVLFTTTMPAVRAATIVVALVALMRCDIAGATLSVGGLRAASAAAALLLLAIALWRRPAHRDPLRLALALAALAVAPILALVLASSIMPHDALVSLASGMGWELLVALAVGGYFAVVMTLLRAPDDRSASPWWGIVAAATALLVGLIGVEAWHPLAMHTGMGWSTWGEWYAASWLVPIALMLPRTPPRMRLLALATTAGVLAALATWATSLDRRMELAHADLDRLAAQSDTAAISALDSFAITARVAHATTLARLYAAWSGSSLAREGVPTYLALWRADGVQRDAVALDSLALGWEEIQPMVQSAGDEARRFGLSKRIGHHEVLILPLAPDTIATVAIGPRTRLLVPTTFGLLVGWRAPPSDPPYTVTVPSDPAAVADGQFHRENRFIRADMLVTGGDVPHVVRAEVTMLTPQPFLIRAALAVLGDVLVLGGLWLVLQRLLGLQPPLPAGVFRRSYRRTVATTLMAFFIVPAALLTLSSVLRLRTDSQQQHAAEMKNMLSDVALNGGLAAAELALPARDSIALARRRVLAESLATIGDNVNAAIGLYRQGRLYVASDSLLAKLGLVPPVFDRTLRTAGDADTNTLRTPLLHASLRLGRMATPFPGTTLLVAVPGSETTLAREGVDQALRLVLVGLLGVIASLLVAGIIARRLGQPIDTLRRTAIAIGRKEALPRADQVPSEFVPVFSAITQMEQDLLSSEAELQADRTRTAAILATVATGVVGIDQAGRVTHANPRAAELFGREVLVGEPLAVQLPVAWERLADAISRLAGSRGVAESRELSIGERLVAATLAPLGDGGVVLAMTDITEASRAARIVAWGEMARQVAHEIKNPLTPMRLGLQHLRRLRADNTADFPKLVDETAERLLVEIERLDRIARSFARYGSPPEAAAPLEPIDLAEATTEMITLFGLGAERMQVALSGEALGPVLARREELVQVLLNLVDNARQAGASQVELRVAGHTLAVVDNGRGITPDQLGRIFEPSFSTTTSGTGLGLAIVRRLVEGWEATIGVDSVPGNGATFTIRFRPGGPFS
ncbi:MAG TPA: ATP-binding protein [Gemmatimonadales bacterium]